MSEKLDLYIQVNCSADKEVTIKTQEAHIRECCQNNGYEVVGAAKVPYNDRQCLDLLLRILYETSPKLCEHCGQDKWEADGCLRGPIIHNGVEYDPIPVGDHWDYIGDGAEEFKKAQTEMRCFACSAKKGHYHHLGCRIETCPVCHMKLWNCGCSDESTGESFMKKQEESRKAYLFLRVASKDNQETALNHQEARLREYCQKKAYEIVGLTRVQCSGFECSSRLDEILTKVDRGLEFQVLLGVSPERFSRNHQDIYDYQKKFEQRGIELESLQGKLELSLPGEWLGRFWEQQP